MSWDDSGEDVVPDGGDDGPGTGPSGDDAGTPGSGGDAPGGPEDDPPDMPEWALAALTRLVDASVVERLAIALASTLLALAIGLVIVAAAGYDAVLFIDNMVYGVFGTYSIGELFGTENRVATTLRPTVTFILTGVAVAIAFRAGVFNIGVQGQFVVGGFAASVTIVSVAPELPVDLAYSIVITAVPVLAWVASGAVIGFLIRWVLETREQSIDESRASLAPLLFGVLGGGLTALWARSWIIRNIGEHGAHATLIIVLATLAAIAGGGLYAMLPGILKAYADANEIITTIMLNFIASGVVFYLIDSFFRPDGTFFVRTARFPGHVEFPQPVFAGSSFSLYGLAIALATAAAVFLIMERTRFGYDLVTSGYQPEAASFSGVDAKRTIVATMTFSGMIAGLAGAVYVVMVLSYYSNPSSIPTYGFDAIAVSLLAGNNPLGAIPAGLLFGGLESGGNYVNQSSDVPRQLIDGVIGLVVLFVAAPELFRMAGKRMGLGGEGR